ncbi:unnamed protein product [Periconia digitata]|uniref:Uncharacterized protein n=1 Tax=Periconia digitata TaxID=1303443 RepID=A0A9W4XLI8_9PLEO|nr:unnamed protein product [Periconia digitata]
MPSIKSIFLFAAGAAAQVTTSVWLPGGSDFYYDSYSYGDSSDFVEKFEGSVVSKDGDKTVMALNGIRAATSGEDSYRLSTQTVTFIGTTSFAFVSVDDYHVGHEETYSMGCSLAESTKAVCNMGMVGSGLYESYCSYYTATSSTYGPETYTFTDVYTYSNPPQTVTSIETWTDDSYNYYTPRVPSYCQSGSTLPESIYRSTMTVRPQTYDVIVTAAAEKLTATAGPTPTGTNATNSNNGSGSPQNTGGPNPSQSGEAPPANNAAPMVTLAPAMAGLGAAIAAVML